MTSRPPRVLVNPLDDVSMERVINVRRAGSVAPRSTVPRHRARPRHVGLRACSTTKRERRRRRARRSPSWRRPSRTRVARPRTRRPRCAIESGIGYIAHLRRSAIGGGCPRREPARVAERRAYFDEQHGGGLASTRAREPDDQRGSSRRRSPRVADERARRRGLEFDHVFVAGLEEGVFPHERALDEDGGIEEGGAALCRAHARAADALARLGARTDGRRRHRPSDLFQLPEGDPARLHRRRVHDRRRRGRRRGQASTTARSITTERSRRAIGAGRVQHKVGRGTSCASAATACSSARRSFRLGRGARAAARAPVCSRSANASRVNDEALAALRAGLRALVSALQSGDATVYSSPSSTPCARRRSRRRARRPRRILTPTAGLARMVGRPAVVALREYGEVRACRRPSSCAARRTGKDRRADLTSSDRARASRSSRRTSGRPERCSSRSPSVTSVAPSSARSALTDTSSRARRHLFDEIDTPPAMQSKLPRVAGGECGRSAAEKIKKVDVRVIAATNRPRTARRQGRFRQDLFYRLNVSNSGSRCARRRRRLLARRLLAAAAAKAGRALRFSPAAEAALARARWPGNVRQLQNEVQRLAALAAGPEVAVEDLSVELRALV